MQGTEHEVERACTANRQIGLASFDTGFLKIAKQSTEIPRRRQGSDILQARSSIWKSKGHIVRGKCIAGRRWRKKGVVEVMAYTVGREVEPPMSRKKKSIEKVAIPLWWEVNLGGEKAHAAGKGMAAGALAHWKGHAALHQYLN